MILCGDCDTQMTQLPTDKNDSHKILGCKKCGRVIKTVKGILEEVLVIKYDAYMRLAKSRGLTEDQSQQVAVA